MQPPENTEASTQPASTCAERPRESFLTGSQTERRQRPLGEEIAPPVTFGPFQIAYLGRRGGLKALRVNVGRHTLDLFATSGPRSARIIAEIDGKKLVRRCIRRRWRIWSRDLDVRRWIIAAAAETDDTGAPRWSCYAIARNLKRARRAQVSSEVVRRLLWRIAPDLAQRRADYQRTTGARLKRLGKKNSGTRETRAAQRAAVVAEMKKAGVL